jgi:signal peptidase I
MRRGSTLWSKRRRLRTCGRSGGAAGVAAAYDGAMSQSQAKPGSESNIVEVLQSLIVAFVLAMAFRGFVLEGFVIPSGSMAPTLMGEHVRWTSSYTGWQFPFDTKQAMRHAERFEGSRRAPQFPVADPMLSPEVRPWSVSLPSIYERTRMGDRVLVMKSMYFFSWLSDLFAPARWDVVVFKCPPDPVGERQNYIKRLIGLPGETLLLGDGDVFTSTAAGASIADLRVQRKPDYIQRAVWQPVYHSDYVPSATSLETGQLDADTKIFLRKMPPWKGEGWRTADGDLPVRTYRCESSAPSTLRWDESVRRIDDWNSYNIASNITRLYAMADIRVGAAVEAADPAALTMSFRIAARAHLFDYELKDGRATLRLTRAEDGLQIHEASVAVGIPKGDAFDVEFWHVDQRMAIYLNDELACELLYDWSANERLQHAFIGRTVANYNPDAAQPPHAKIEWAFEGSPVSLRRVRLDRDLYYRPVNLQAGIRVPDDFEPTSRGMGFGVDPEHPAVLGEDHFMMCGDNSGDSQDARLWGAPHALAEMFIEPTPFVVHRKLLLGKAWSVYLPSPVPLGASGRTLIPDFGRLRFIR